MSNTISELEEFKDCEAVICNLPPSDTDCPNGFSIVVASPYGYTEVCIEEEEYECLKHLGVLTTENSADDIKVSVMLDILKHTSKTP